jgi:hypothetical protein
MEVAVTANLDRDYKLQQLVLHQAQTVRRLAFLTMIITTLAASEEVQDNDLAGLIALLKEMREEKIDADDR